MTKRLITFSIVLVLLFINSAYADTTRMKGNFTIRNGITYRMPRENIIAAEKAYGTTQEAIDTTISVLDNDAPEGYTKVNVVRFNRMTLLGEEHDHCSLALICGAARISINHRFASCCKRKAEMPKLQFFGLANPEKSGMAFQPKL